MTYVPTWAGFIYRAIVLDLLVVAQELLLREEPFYLRLFNLVGHTLNSKRSPRDSS